MRINKQLIARALLITVSIGLCLFFTLWLAIMFVNFRYELSDFNGNTVIYKSQYGNILQHVTFAMYCVAILSLVTFWLRGFIHKDVIWKKISIALLTTESVLMCVVICLIPFVKRDLVSIAYSLNYLDHVVVSYLLLYVPYIIFVFVSCRYWKTRRPVYLLEISER